jgi:hypothetical protein
MLIIASTTGSIVVGDCAYGAAPPIVEDAAAPPAEPAPCDADARYVAPAEVAAGLPLVPCPRREADAVCETCATCAPGAWCAPVKTRGIGPRSPGGGPDD